MGGLFSRRQPGYFTRIEQQEQQQERERMMGMPRGNTIGGFHRDVYDGNWYGAQAAQAPIFAKAGSSRRSGSGRSRRGAVGGAPVRFDASYNPYASGGQYSEFNPYA